MSYSVPQNFQNHRVVSSLLVRNWFFWSVFDFCGHFQKLIDSWSSSSSSSSSAWSSMGKSGFGSRIIEKQKETTPVKIRGTICFCLHIFRGPAKQKTTKQPEPEWLIMLIGKYGIPIDVDCFNSHLWLFEGQSCFWPPTNRYYPWVY